MSPMTHWAAHYIGEAYDRQENHCWSFCRRVWHDRFGFDVPAVPDDIGALRAVAQAFRDHDERRLWTAVEVPAEGDAVLMAHSRYPTHVGIWVDADGGGVLHCQEGCGVVFSSRASLAKNGWGRVEFYRRTMP